MAKFMNNFQRRMNFKLDIWALGYNAKPHINLVLLWSDSLCPPKIHMQKS